jgi:hypothetical protein
MAIMRRVSSALVMALAVLATPVAAPAQEKIRLGLIPISEALGAVIADKQGAATRDINQAWTGLNPAFKDKVLLPQLGTAINVAGMARTMELMQKFGLLKAPIDISPRVLAVP